MSEGAAKLSLVRRQVEDVLVVDLVGNLVVGPEATLMRQEMEKALATGRSRVLINLARVQYMDSTGIGVLLAAKTSAINRKVHLKVCCVPSFVARLLAQLQLTKILDVYEQESTALESF